MKDIFDITNFIDEARWGCDSNNEELVNYRSPDILSAKYKLLTHWLCYICDRQISFELIWDLGGFVFSDMLEDIQKNKGEVDIMDELLSPNGDSSYFISRNKYSRLNNKFRLSDGDNNEYLFVSKHTVSNNQRLINIYNLDSNSRPKFISRFYPTDYFSIASTLSILQDYDFNIIKYIDFCLEGNLENISKRILFSLYLLSYHEIGQQDNSIFKNKAILKNHIYKRNDKISKIVADKNLHEVEFYRFINSNNIYKQKRAWCAFRDYLKSNLKLYFIDELKNEKSITKEKLFDDKNVPRKNVLVELELPGDVWNNNKIFRNCLFGEQKSKLPMPQLLREIYNENKNVINSGYPEQFDMTFDFVPRMCTKKSNCLICPYGLLNNKAELFGKLCVRNSTFFCTILYVSCGYRIPCKGDKCLLLKFTKP